MLGDETTAPREPYLTPAVVTLQEVVLEPAHDAAGQLAGKIQGSARLGIVLTSDVRHAIELVSPHHVTSRSGISSDNNSASARRPL